VFLGFAVAGASGLSVRASAIGLVSFPAGAVAGGRVGLHFSSGVRRRWLALAGAVETVLLLVATLCAIGVAPDSDAARQTPIIILIAVAMGWRNATIRRLGRPDVTTTVLTLTLTGLAAQRGGGPRCRGHRRLRRDAGVRRLHTVSAPVADETHQPLALSQTTIRDGALRRRMSAAATWDNALTRSPRARYNSRCSARLKHSISVSDSAIGVERLGVDGSRDGAPISAETGDHGARGQHRRPDPQSAKPRWQNRRGSSRGRDRDRSQATKAAKAAAPTA
jgi:hypothetical protein